MVIARCLRSRGWCRPRLEAHHYTEVLSRRTMHVRCNNTSPTNTIWAPRAEPRRWHVEPTGAQMTVAATCRRSRRLRDDVGADLVSKDHRCTEVLSYRTTHVRCDNTSPTKTIWAPRAQIVAGMWSSLAPR